MIKIKNKLFFVLFIAFLVRLISLNQSFWLDEATSAQAIRSNGFFQIIRDFSPRDFHPPLYYLFMKIWTNIFGFSEIVLRLPSVIFSILTGYFVYKIAILIDSGRASPAGMTKENIGYWAAAIFLFNPLIVYYSQEARMYMMASFTLTSALYFFLKFHLEASGKNRQNSASIRSRNKSVKSEKNLILFNIFATLSFLTFYGSIFLIIPMVFYLFYNKHYKLFLTSILSIAFSILILSPLLYQQFKTAKYQLTLVLNWNQVLGAANLKNLLLIPLKFSIGRISFYPKWLYWGLSAIWTGFVWYLVFKGGLKNKFLLYLLLVPLIFGFFISFFTPLLQYFRFLYLIPITSLLIALGFPKDHLKGGSWIIVTGFALFSLIYLLNSNFHREDWRSLTKSLPADKVYMIYSSSDPVQYYKSDVQIVDLKSMDYETQLEEVIYLIPYSSEIHGISYQVLLRKRNYEPVNKLVFNGVELETWRRKSEI